MASNITLNDKLSIQWCNTIDEIAAGEWEKIFGNTLIKGYSFFRSIQFSDFPDIEYHYLKIYIDNKIVSIIPCFTYDLNLTDILVDKISKYFIRQMRKVSPRFGMYKNLVVGSYTATCEHFVEIIPELTDNETQKVIEEINIQLETKRKETKCGLIFVKDVRRKHLPYITKLLSKNFHFFSSFPTTFIPVNNNNLYPTALRKKQRQRYTKYKKRFDDEFTWEVVIDFSKYVSELNTLYLNVLERAKNKFEVLNESFFRNINLYFGDKSYLIVARDKQQNIRLMEIVLEEEDRLLPLYLGIKYLEDDTKVLYLNAIFKTIKEAEVKGKDIVEFGQTSYYPKVMSGAFAEDLCYGFYAKSRVMNFIIKHFFKYLFTPTKILPHVYLQNHIDEVKTQLKRKGFETMNG